MSLTGIYPVRVSSKISLGNFAWFFYAISTSFFRSTHENFRYFFRKLFLRFLCFLWYYWRVIPSRIISLTSSSVVEISLKLCRKLSRILWELSSACFVEVALGSSEKSYGSFSKSYSWIPPGIRPWVSSLTPPGICSWIPLGTLGIPLDNLMGSSYVISWSSSRTTSRFSKGFLLRLLLERSGISLNTLLWFHIEYSKVLKLLTL